MKHLTLEQIQQIPELRKTKTNQEIADLLGVSRTTINNWVRVYRDKGEKIARAPHPSNMKRLV